MTMQIMKDEKSLGEFATITGYHDMVEHIKSCKDSGFALRHFIQAGETNEPDKVAQQARKCAEHAKISERSCLMTVYKILKGKSGTVSVES